MVGISRFDGSEIDDREHTIESVIDILTTPYGSRALNREYGSKLFMLVDDPINNAAKIYASISTALKIEKTYRLTRSKIADIRPGEIEIELDGIYVPTGERLPIAFELRKAI